MLAKPSETIIFHPPYSLSEAQVNPAGRLRPSKRVSPVANPDRLIQRAGDFPEVCLFSRGSQASQPIPTGRISCTGCRDAPGAADPIIPCYVTDNPAGPAIATPTILSPVVVSKVTPVTQPRYDSACGAVKAKSDEYWYKFWPY